MDTCRLCNRCDLFNGDINLPEDTRIMYKYHYCLAKENRWEQCKRFIFENINGYCPDFVMPNSLLTLDQIWQKTQRGFALSR